MGRFPDFVTKFELKIFSIFWNLLTRYLLDKLPISWIPDFLISALDFIEADKEYGSMEYHLELILHAGTYL